MTKQPPQNNLQRWERAQCLVMDIINVRRHHYILGTNRRENVVEHSFSVALLCWSLFNFIKPPLDLTKIFKYALAHDFLERKQDIDTSSFAHKDARKQKRIQEAKELEKIQKEFYDFGELPQIIHNYEEKVDEESLFVWSVDKMQPILLGYLDNWRPYALENISYEAFCDKYDKVVEDCSPYVRDFFKEIYEYGRSIYYDQPDS